MLRCAAERCGSRIEMRLRSPCAVDFGPCRNRWILPSPCPLGQAPMRSQISARNQSRMGREILSNLARHAGFAQRCDPDRRVPEFFRRRIEQTIVPPPPTAGGLAGSDRAGVHSAGSRGRIQRAAPAASALRITRKPCSLPNHDTDRFRTRSVDSLASRPMGNRPSIYDLMPSVCVGHSIEDFDRTPELWVEVLTSPAGPPLWWIRCNDTVSARIGSSRSWRPASPCAGFCAPRAPGTRRALPGRARVDCVLTC